MHVRQAVAPADVAALRALLVAREDELNIDGEIYWAARDPAIRRSAALRSLRSLASQLLGRPAARWFDHAIHRAPDDGARTTRWHQDLAYARWGRMPAVHLWLPLQDVDVDHGPLQYLPSPHPSPQRPHRPIEGTSRLELAVDPAAAVTCPAEGGDVLAHLPATPHAALPNRGAGERWTWTVQFWPWWGLPLRAVRNVVPDRATGEGGLSAPS